MFLLKTEKMRTSIFEAKVCLYLYQDKIGSASLHIETPTGRIVCGFPMGFEDLVKEFQNAGLDAAALNKIEDDRKAHMDRILKRVDEIVQPENIPPSVE